VREALEGVDAARAARRPAGGGHSIWEIALHIGVWEGIVRRRLAGESITALPPAEDWPAVTDTSEAAWQRTRATLLETHRQLRAAMAAFPEARLAEMVPGTKTPRSFYGEMHGLLQHDIYHAGQISLLKRQV
jgi:uncharacterized damage-inducible protein DinB